MHSRSCLALLGGLVWLTCGLADPIELRTTDGQTVVTYKGIQFLQLDAKHSRYLLTRGVVAKFKKTSVTITSDQATVLATTYGNNTALSSIDAVGNVKLEKVDRRASGTVTSIFTSNRIEYLDSKAGSSAVCKGHVLLSQIDQAKHTTLHATGGSGVATFLGGVQTKNNRLTSATLHAPVEIDINQAPVNGVKATKAHISCAEMVYRLTPTSGTLELSGAIRMKSNQGTLSNLSHATIHLTEKGEIKDFNGSSGA